MKRESARKGDRDPMAGELACYRHMLDDRGEMPGSPDIRIERAYDLKGEASSAAGRRVLVDRVWPRGVSKEQLHLDAWLRDVAPSTELRRWFGHDPAKWTEFQRRYRRELAEPERRAALDTLVDMARAGRLTLVFGARDAEHNQAVVLRDVLELRLLAPSIDVTGQPNRVAEEAPPGR